MNSVISFCGVFVLVFMSIQVFGGHHGIVDDEIWSHVFKVLSDTEHGKKVVVSHPEPAHLVDAYTKVYHHEPFGYHDAPHHHGYLHGHHHHGYHAPPALYHGHLPHAAPYHAHPHPLPVLHHGPPPLPVPLHHHHHHHAPEPIFRVPVPTVLNTYGPPHLHHHHKK